MGKDREPKDSGAEAEPQPKPAAGRRVSPGLIAAAVLVLAVVVVGAVLLTGGKGRTQYVGQTQERARSYTLLDIPTLDVSDITISVPVDSAAAQRKNLTVSVTVRFAPPEGEEGDAKKIAKEVMPRVANLRPDFRDLIITALGDKDYGKLTSAEVKNQLLTGFKQSFNEVLCSYGLNKEVVVEKVMWKDFAWD